MARSIDIEILLDDESVKISGASSYYKNSKDFNNDTIYAVVSDPDIVYIRYISNIEYLYNLFHKINSSVRKDVNAIQFSDNNEFYIANSKISGANFEMKTENNLLFSELILIKEK